MAEMTEVYLSLGSNVGDSKAHIAKAVQLLGEHFKDLKQAPLYSSKAVHYNDQPALPYVFNRAFNSIQHVGYFIQR